MIVFSKPAFIGEELSRIEEAIKRGNIANGSYFSGKCEKMLSEMLSCEDVFLTSSGSSAFEIIAQTLDIQPGDEVIAPSFTYVSTVNAFVGRGARVRFVDIDATTLNIQPEGIEAQISERTKAIIVLHYAGVSCKMKEIMALSKKYNIPVIEDAALGFDSDYNGKALGSIAQFGVLSFHETKNITCGEGGAIIVNDPNYLEKVNTVRYKGTNRWDFNHGDVTEYEWIGNGGHYLMPELNAAYLYTQLQHADKIQEKRRKLWYRYKENLNDLELNGAINLSYVPGTASTNGSVFYILCGDREERKALIEFLKSKRIQAIIHYRPLHLSPYYQEQNDPVNLKVTEVYANTLLRLPLHYDLSVEDQDHVISAIKEFYDEH